MATAQAERTIPTGVWKSDPIHSHAGFAVKHTAATFHGDFREFEAVLSNEDGEPRLSGSVDVESADVRDETLKGHLLSPDFFDSERYPKIAFESTGLRTDGDEVVIEGELTLKGSKKTVEARGTLSGPITGPDDSKRIGIDLEAKVDRTDYGLDWNAELPGGGVILGDEVTITVQLELVKEA